MCLRLEDVNQGGKCLALYFPDILSHQLLILCLVDIHTWNNMKIQDKIPLKKITED